MKAAIFANESRSFIPILARGLQRMFQQIEVESKIFYEGYELIKSTELLKKFTEELSHFDMIVIVIYIPAAFLRDYFIGIELIRSILPQIPIIYYAHYYLPTRGPWIQWLKEGSPENGVPQGDNWGLERYDWYLVASVVSEYPMPGGEQPYSLIGLNLNDGTLYPARKETFIALIDFERPAHLKEREIQIQALEETATPYIILNGDYTNAQIREIYRKCSIYFVAHRESFGLPICELQICGSYIFTPFTEWCPSHWLKKDLKQPGPGDLPANFIVYHNDKAELIEKIRQVKQDYKPEEVFQCFIKNYPQFFNGDIKELKKFIHGIKTKKITSQSHYQYINLKF